MRDSFLKFSHDMLESLPVHEGIKTMNSAAGKKDTECWGEVGLLSSFFLLFDIYDCKYRSSSEK